MDRRLTNKASIKYETNGYHFLISIRRVKNTNLGHPRYEVDVTPLDTKDNYVATYVYRFTGYFELVEDIAAYALKLFLTDRYKEREALD